MNTKYRILIGGVLLTVAIAFGFYSAYATVQRDANRKQLIEELTMENAMLRAHDAEHHREYQ